MTLTEQLVNSLQMVQDKRNNRDHILQTATKLFAKKGFDGTSVDSLASAAGVNKALIYYYFKNKKAIISSIFGEMLLEMDQQSGEATVSRADPEQLKTKIGKELTYLQDREQEFSLLFMETLKEGNDGEFLFQLTKKVIQKELQGRGFGTAEATSKTSEIYKKAVVHEFFTGIMPILSFVMLRRKFAAEFEFELDELDDIFLDLFEQSHLRSHIKAPDTD